MCDLAIALTLASTVVGAMGSIQQGQAAAAAHEYNAKVQEMNAKMFERRAKDAVERGAFEEQKKRQEVARIVGAQQVAMAANGVDLSFGSPMDVIVDTAVMGELDALTIRSNAYRESYDYKVEATNARAGATMSRMAGSAARTGGYLDAMGTVLTGAGKAYQGHKASTIGRIV